MRRIQSIGVLVILAGLMLGGCSQDKTAGVKIFSRGDAQQVLKEQGVSTRDAKLYVHSNGYQVMISLVSADQTKSYYLVNANGELIDRPKTRDDFLRAQDIWLYTRVEQKNVTGLDMTGRYRVALWRDDQFSTRFELTPLQGPPAEPIRIGAVLWVPESCIVISDNDVWFFHEDQGVAQMTTNSINLKHYFRTDPSANWQIEKFRIGHAWLAGCDKAGKRILIERDTSNLLLWNSRSLNVVDLATKKETKVHVSGNWVRVFME